MAAIAANKFPMTFDEAWPILQEGAINKIIDYLELEERPNANPLTSEEYMLFYTIVYNICTSKSSYYTELQKLYDQYKRTFEDYISSKVLPSLREKDNENLLRELLRRWNNHRIMAKSLSRFFDYLSRSYIQRNKLPSLEEASNSTFSYLVCRGMKDQVSDAIATLRMLQIEGGKTDSAMVKEVMDIYEELAEEIVWKHCERAIEKAIEDFKKLL